MKKAIFNGNDMNLHHFPCFNTNNYQDVCTSKETELRLIESHDTLQGKMAIQRSYHTIEHVYAMLDFIQQPHVLIDERLGTSESHVELRLAIWFHDVYYDPTGELGVSEQISATLATTTLRNIGYNEDTCNRVEKAILATNHNGNLKVYNDYTDILLDADLAILAASKYTYIRYADGIRREYAHVPYDKYIIGRHAVLKSFLDRPQIYRLKNESMEEVARRNLKMEMEVYEAQSNICR